MPLLISDANIFIDFEAGDILCELFELPDRIAVPDMLFEEELRARHEELIVLGLALLELKPAAVERTAQLAAQYRSPSRNDLAALALAEQERCPLITGDRRLRAAAEREGVAVHGTLWAAGRLVEVGVLDVPTLETAYARMGAAQRRLPWDEVEEQLSRLAEQGSHRSRR